MHSSSFKAVRLGLFAFLHCCLYGAATSLQAAPQDKAVTFVSGHLILTDKNASDRQLLEGQLTIQNLKTEENEMRVFPPEAEQGKFFALLAPNQTYRVSILPQGFEKAYTFELHIPAQTYYYELDKEIEFETVMLLGKKVKEKAVLKREYQRLLKVEDSLKANAEQLRYDFMIAFQDYLFSRNDPTLFEVAQDLIDEGTIEISLANYQNAADTAPDAAYDKLFTTLENAFEDGDSLLLTSLYRDETNQGYFISNVESDTKNGQNRPEYAFSLPIAEKVQPDLRTVIQRHFIFFDKTQRRTLDVSQSSKLDEIIEWLNREPKASIEIYGRFPALENAQKDRSQQLHDNYLRTRTVYRYIKKRLHDKGKLEFIVFGLNHNLEVLEKENGADSKAQVEIRICGSNQP
jgi:hypothetical protein